MYRYWINVASPTGKTDMHGQPMYSHLFTTEKFDSEIRVNHVEQRIRAAFPDCKVSVYRQIATYEQVS